MAFSEAKDWKLELRHRDLTDEVKSGKAEKQRAEYKGMDGR